MAEPFVGQIALFAFPFAPAGWAMCHGQAVSIAQNTVLYSIIGSAYGGDAKTYFNLPDLQARAAVGSGQGPGLSNYSIGDAGGAATTTLKEGELALHSHVVGVGIDPANAVTPADNGLAKANERIGADNYYVHLYSPNPQFARDGLAPNTIGFAGGSGPHNNMQPYLAMNFCIALTGVFPQR
jgi:microcystin-dependent protein